MLTHDHLENNCVVVAVAVVAAAAAANHYKVWQMVLVEVVVDY